MFIVDISGSNSGTDPQGKRGTNIQAFYDANKSNDKFRWGVITFSGGATAEIADSGGTAIFTKDEALVQTAIGKVNQATGGTAFVTGLETAERAIKNDRRVCPQHNSTYMIFFLADGTPGDGAQVPAAIDELLKAAPNVYLSSAYYGPDSPGLEQVMEDMAIRGGGKYTNFNKTDTLDFNQLLVQPEVEPWRVRDHLLMIYNATAAPCEDGSMGADSDIDFLCDRDEVKYGFDPTNAFSIPAAHADKAEAWKGYRDWFRLQAIQSGETLTPCEDRTNEDFDLLTACEEEYYVANDQPLGTDEQVGNPDLFDMDRDGFLDGIELAMFRQASYVIDYTNTRRNFDGEPEDAGTQIRQHRNPLQKDEFCPPF